MADNRILVVDDDPIAGSLARDVLSDAGFEVELLNQSLQALATIKKKGYRVVLLDILMPGIDGLTLCRQIKSDPQTRSVKVIVVSGKSFKADIDKAMQQGADLFIEKPYSVEDLPAQIREIVETPSSAAKPTPAAPASGLSSNPNPTASVTIWGCRSLSETPSLISSRYGLKTPCISIEAGRRLFVFDAGTGLNALEQDILKAGSPTEFWLFLTHFDKAHIEGLRTSACARSADFKLKIGAAPEPGQNLSEMIQEAFVASEMELDSIQAGIEIFEVIEKSYEITAGVKLFPFYANHPGRTLGFVLETGGRKIVYCPDDELYGEAATSLQDFDERLSKIVEGADLLIHDARWTDEDYLKNRNSGHSSFVSAVNLAGKSGVKRLVLFHHHDLYGDETLDAIAKQAAALIAEQDYSLECVMAREGLKVSI